MEAAKGAPDTVQRALPHDRQLIVLSKLLLLRGQVAATEFAQRVKDGMCIQIKGTTFEVAALQEALRLWTSSTQCRTSVPISSVPFSQKAVESAHSELVGVRDGLSITSIKRDCSAAGLVTLADAHAASDDSSSSSTSSSECDGSDNQIFHTDTSGDRRQPSLLQVQSAEPTRLKETQLNSSLRQGVRKILLEALESFVKTQNSHLGKRKLPPLDALAADVEQALCETLGLSKTAYTSQARSIQHNLKDAKNATFGYNVITGKITASELPSLSAENMASDAKTAERQQLRKQAAEEIQLDWDLRHGTAGNVNGTFRCGKCGSRKTVYMQTQSRSCDEPMRTTVQCMQCRKRWRVG